MRLIRFFVFFQPIYAPPQKKKVKIGEGRHINGKNRLQNKLVHICAVSKEISESKSTHHCKLKHIHTAPKSKRGRK